MSPWEHLQGIAPSAASYDYMVKTLCMNLRVDRAWQIAAQMQQNADVCATIILFAVSGGASCVTRSLNQWRINRNVTLLPAEPTRPIIWGRCGQ